MVANEDQPSADWKSLIRCSTGIPEAEVPPIERTTGNAVPLRWEHRSGPYWPLRIQNYDPSSACGGVTLEVWPVVLLVATANENSRFVNFYIEITALETSYCRIILIQLSIKIELGWKTV